MYPPPPATSYTTAMALVTVVSMASAAISETGRQLQYSKFWNVGAKKSTPKLPGKMGMLLMYTPAFLIGLASFGIFPNEGLRFVLLKLALTIHFFKRLCEVLFVHKYSGPMFLDIAIAISLSYFIQAATMIYAQHLTQGLQEPLIDLKFVGIPIFLVGLSGNFYHHYLLSKLRGEGEKGYKIPRGGLFNLLICPHYLFEILGFIGVSCIAQTLYAFSYTLGSAMVLMGRSYATRKWYLSKFEDFPKDVKAFIPFVF
ncbi:hypothetical protein RHSIM_Rhsim09G0139900 [Rhododendron simsii]|uniref:3-oxo-5-alpha-steroid 4-dehydrogenase C-terminal domain-containing protein n=1 Tax=Rhododendron simsii TaxID=118357 RepID=A0A834LEE1_RHOSS|nr:hypothetical protein RHSIM_Rhsim09G0139900 [Rhododendron simsii]